MELTKLQTLTDRKFQESIVPGKKEHALTQANLLLQAEKKKLADLIVKIQAFLRGTPAESIIEQM